MKEYSLLTKDMETINTVRCNSFEEAIEYFAEKKRLSTTDLMSIFEVVILPADSVGGASRK
jgi:hypothetical protein